MTKIGPTSRIKLIRTLRKIGFTGPFSGGKHFFMSRGAIDVVLPNPHTQDIGTDLLVRILKQANVSRSEWIKHC